MPNDVLTKEYSDFEIAREIYETIKHTRNFKALIFKRIEEENGTEWIKYFCEKYDFKKVLRRTRSRDTIGAIKDCLVLNKKESL